MAASLLHGFVWPWRSGADPCLPALPTTLSFTRGSVQHTDGGRQTPSSGPLPWSSSKQNLEPTNLNDDLYAHTTTTPTRTLWAGPGGPPGVPERSSDLLPQGSEFRAGQAHV
ncbi:unnamed protein product [Gadus morhua 'NCC']